MHTKKCLSCECVKPLTDFYKHKEMSDGRLNFCKVCKKQYAIKNRNEKIDYYQKYDRDRGNRQDSDYVRNYRSKYPNKYNAHNMLNNYLRDSKLVKPSFCEACNKEKNFMHIITII